MVEAKVSQYLIEPGEKRPGRVESLHVPVGKDESLLGEVQRVLAITHKTQRNKICVLHIPSHNSFECLFRAPSTTLHHRYFILA